MSNSRSLKDIQEKEKGFEHSKEAVTREISRKNGASKRLCLAQSR